MKKLLIALLGSSLLGSAIACTAVNIQAADGSTIAGRTMEWAYDNMEWTLLFYPQNTSYSITAPANTKLPPVKLVSKYAVLGIGSGLAEDAMLEGQNSVGLGISANFLPGFSKFQQVSKSDKHYVSAIEFVRFVLSNYGSVAEAAAALPKYKVWLPNLSNTPEQATLHFMITDKTGSAIVVEFVDGQMKIYDKNVGVMTNAPTYDWQLTNIRNYINLTNEATTQKQAITTGEITNVSQGGGGLGLPGDYMSPSRFIKATFLKYYSDKPQNGQEAIGLTMHIIHTVDIPKGAVSSVGPDKKIYSDYTQWVAIKDLGNNVLYFTDYNHADSYVKYDLNKLVTQSKAFVIPISNLQYPNNDLTNTIIK